MRQEFHDGKSGEVGLFAATLPLEALKLLVSDAATRKPGRLSRSSLLNDVARAVFEAPLKREIFIELPEEDCEPEDGQEDILGRLNKSLYGAQDAASNFQQKVTMQVGQVLASSTGCEVPSTW